MPEETTYKGKWEIIEPTSDFNPTHFLHLVNKKGETLIAIEAGPHVGYGRPCVFLVHDNKKRTHEGYFDEKQLKEWFDKTGIKIRPPYHKIARESKEWYEKYSSEFD